MVESERKVDFRKNTLLVATYVAIIKIGRRIDSKVWAVTLGILVGGVSGNLSDRIFRAPGGLNGGVVDWIQLPHWPVFNFADIAIDVSVIAIVILLVKKIPLNSERPKNG